MKKKTRNLTVEFFQIKVTLFSTSFVHSLKPTEMGMNLRNNYDFFMVKYENKCLERNWESETLKLLHLD